MFAQHWTLRLRPRTCSRRRSFLRCVCSSRRSTYSRSSSISSLTCCTVSNSCLIATMSRLTSDTSDWQDSTDLVSSCSWVLISHNATVVSRCRSPRCSSSSLALRFMLITLTCFCRLRFHGRKRKTYISYLWVRVKIWACNCGTSDSSQHPSCRWFRKLDRRLVLRRDRAYYPNA